MEGSQTRSQALLVLTSLPDEASAQALATALVTERLAACVNILAPCQSVYRWQGQIESTIEVPLQIKSTTACYAALEVVVLAHHPYELPEIIAVPIAHGLPEYLAWLITETRAETLLEPADGNPV